MAWSKRQLTWYSFALAWLIVGAEAAAQTDSDAQQEMIQPLMPVEQVNPQDVLARNLPIERRTKIGHRQYGVTSVDHQDGDRFQVMTTFTNGRRQEGGYFCAEIGVVGTDDLLLVRIRQRAGVDVGIGWMPTKAIIEDSFDLSPEQAEEVQTIDIAHYACQSIEESKIWIGAKAIAGDIITDHGGDVFSQPQSHLPRERLGQF
ncbi:MAG: hypothetical protein ACR2QH_14620 [Geminicoccaceae bacterium]